MNQYHCKNFREYRWPDGCEMGRRQDGHNELTLSLRITDKTGLNVRLFAAEKPIDFDQYRIIAIIDISVGSP